MAKRENTGLDAAAKRIGSTLGRLARRAAGLDKQRRELAEQIRTAIAQAQAVLKSLGGDAGTDRGPTAKGSGSSKGSKTSTEPTAKMRDSWKRGKVAAAADEHTKPDDGRANIRATGSRNWTNRQPGRG
jgi:hypothetical protein